MLGSSIANVVFLVVLEQLLQWTAVSTKVGKYRPLPQWTLVAKVVILMVAIIAISPGEKDVWFQLIAAGIASQVVVWYFNSGATKYIRLWPTRLWIDMADVYIVLGVFIGVVQKFLLR